MYRALIAAMLAITLAVAGSLAVSGVASGHTGTTSNHSLPASHIDSSADHSRDRDHDGDHDHGGHDGDHHCKGPHAYHPGRCKPCPHRDWCRIPIGGGHDKDHDKSVEVYFDDRSKDVIEATIVSVLCPPGSPAHATCFRVSAYDVTARKFISNFGEKLYVGATDVVKEYVKGNWVALANNHGLCVAQDSGQIFAVAPQTGKSHS